eukprot:jgi/Hompol1/4175/HPOL_003550-RA
MPGGKKKTELGRSLIRSRFNNTKSVHVNPDGSIRHTTEHDETTTNWVNMQSITQENDLEAFLNTAQLAGTEFTAEKLNVTVLQTQNRNTHLPSAEEEEAALAKHELHKNRLTVPRRPKWTKATTADQLKLMERDSFLEWRRGLVFLEEEEGLIMTPYERNIEVWRQLWRVVERSDLIVQIVDGRNPLLFRSKDLEKYVTEVSSAKKNLLLINKADLLTPEQRTAWADYFDEQGIRYTFFSAALAKQQIDDELEAERLQAELHELDMEIDAEDDNDDDYETDDDIAVDDANVDAVITDLDDQQYDEPVPQPVSRRKKNSSKIAAQRQRRVSARSMEGIESQQAEEEVEMQEDQDSLPERIRILGALELVDLFTSECPQTTRTDDPTAKISIGFVGYPNVGKSSTLNAIVGAKKVAVGSTPGKTKHFQTIHLSDRIILCDCPGLVFPSFATTKAEMVCNGVLPIDQLREHVGPANLVCQRIPKYYLEALYGITIKTRGIEGDLVDRQPTAEEFLSAYATARGFAKQSQGNPDESRAARYILKDYVNGKLLYVHPPPGIDGTEFNRQLYEDERLLRRQIKKVRIADLQSKAAAALQETSLSVKQANTSEAKAIDSVFFTRPTVHARTAGKFAQKDFDRVKLFPHNNRVDDVPGGSRSSASTTSNAPLPPKKSHKKGKQHVKHRTQWTKEDL